MSDMDRESKKKAVLISGFGWFEERLKPISEVLEKKGYDVRFYLSDYDHSRKSYIVDRNPRCNYLHVPAYKTNMSISRMLSHKIFGDKIKKVLENEKPDLIYSLLPPNSVAPPCLCYKEKHLECKYYVDLIDLWPGTLQFMSSGNALVNILASSLWGGYVCNFVLHKWADMRDNSLLAADHVFTECDYYHKVLTDCTEKATTLYLFKQINDEDKVTRYITEKITQTKDRLILCYLGSINYLIDIDRICSVLSAVNARGMSVEFRIVGGGESTEEFIAAAKQTGTHVKYYGKIFNREKKLQILGGCDYGFNIMKKDVSVGLTIKSVDYFSMGIPIINGIKGDTWDMVNRENIGVNLEDNYIDEILDRKQNRAKNAFACFKKYFTREAFKKRVERSI